MGSVDTREEVVVGNSLRGYVPIPNKIPMKRRISLHPVIKTMHIALMLP
jgi:hypothetical protein